MKENIRFFITIAILSLFIYGCTRTSTVDENQRSALEINSMSTGIGAVDKNNKSHDIQRFSYSIALTNNDKDTLFITDATLVLPKKFEETLVTKQLTISVNKDILPKSTIEIKGSLDFRANGLSKDDIIRLNPRISSVKVTTERTISLEKWSQ